MTDVRAKACESVQDKLTAYLDGELEGDRATIVRGHLRTCTTCRDLAEREAVLRDGLRDLPTVDPPSTLWAGVQARLAAAEVAEAERPAWRRFLSKLAPSNWMPAPSTLAVGGLVAAAAVAIIFWRVQRDEATLGDVVDVGPSVTAPEKVVKTTPPPVAQTIALGCVMPKPSASGDVSDDLALDAPRLTASYCQAAEDILQESAELRGKWSAEDAKAFEKHVGELLAQANRAEEGQPRQRAMRLLLHYIRKTVAHSNVALASGAN